MKKLLYLRILLLLLLVSPSLSAQNLSKGYANNSDTRFHDLSLPDKWKAEPAVVLNNVVNYNYKIHRRGKYKKLVFSKEGRRQVKLLSRTAIGVFSSFYFSERDSVRFTVIKADGNRQPVSRSEHMNINSSEHSNVVPDYYRSGGEDDNTSFKKLAIPGLQPGDVLDYYYFETDTISLNNKKDLDIPSVFEELQIAFPIKNNEILITHSPEFTPSAYNGNDAPSPLIEPGKVSLKDKDQPGQEQERWTSENQTSPFLYVKLIPGPKITSERNVNFALSEKGDNKLTRDQIFRIRATELARNQEHLSGTIVKRCKKVVSAKCKGNKDKACYAQHAFEYLQHTLIRKPTYHGSGMYRFDLAPMLDENGFPIENAFFIAMLHLLKKKKVPFEVIAAVPPVFGTLDRVPDLESLEWGIRISGEHPVDIFEPNSYTAYGALPSWLYNCELLVASGDRPYDNDGPVTHEKIASVSPSDNLIDEELTVNIRPGMDSLDIERVTLATGKQKAVYSNGLVTAADHTEMTEFYRRTDRSAKDYNNFNFYAEGAKIQYTSQYQERHEEEARKDYLVRDLAGEFDDFNSGDSRLEDSGLNTSSPIRWREEFSMGSRLKLGGENYIFEIGHFLGSQVEIQEDERERKFDIFMRYPRQFVKKVRVTIPEGYSVEGLENLNFEVKNATGSFVSTARIEGQEIVFNSTKTYFHKFEPRENWPLMMEFLDAAKACSRGKVLLRKKS